MSKAFLDRSNQSQAGGSNHNDSAKKKVDPEAQMKWIDMMLKSHDSESESSDVAAQFFARDEEDRQSKAKEEEELQMKPEEAEYSEVDEFDVDGNQKEKNNNNYQANDISFQYPKIDQEVLDNINKQNEIFFAEKQKIYGFIINDIVNLINNNNHAIMEVGYIEPNSEEYNIIWEEIYRNVKIDISLMPVKTDLLKGIDDKFEISDIDIKYHNLSLKEYKIEKLKNIGKEIGSMVYSWGKNIFDILKGKGPEIFGTKIVGLSSLFLNFFLISKEAGKGSSLKERRNNKLNNLRKITNKLLDLYIPVFFDSI